MTQSHLLTFNKHLMHIEGIIYCIRWVNGKFAICATGNMESSSQRMSYFIMPIVGKKQQECIPVAGQGNFHWEHRMQLQNTWLFQALHHISLYYFQFKQCWNKSIPASKLTKNLVLWVQSWCVWQCSAQFLVHSNTLSSFSITASSKIHRHLCFCFFFNP